MNHIAKNNDLVKIITKSNNHEVYIGTLSNLHDIISLTNDDKNFKTKRAPKYDSTLFVNEHPLHKAYGLSEYGCVGICLSDIDSITKIDKKSEAYQSKIKTRSNKRITKKKALEILEGFKTQTELSEYMVGEELQALEYAIKAVKEYKEMKCQNIE